jgi:hypothetical protein
MVYSVYSKEPDRLIQKKKRKKRYSDVMILLPKTGRFEGEGVEGGTLDECDTRGTLEPPSAFL